MKFFKNITLTTLAFIAWITIGKSCTIRPDIAGQTMDVIIYSASLIISLGYLHWLIRYFLLPLDEVPNSIRKNLHKKTNSKFKSGFFAGTIGTGFGSAILYIIIISDLINFSEEDLSILPYFTIGAVFLIVAGNLGYVRQFHMLMAKELLDAKKESKQNDGQISPESALSDELSS